MSFTEVLTHDRGLGSAYERYYFYQLLQTWADRIGAKSFLEGPIDGMAGVSGVHGVGLARHGMPVTAVVRSEEQAAATRAVYKRAHADQNVDVRVMSDLSQIESLPKADLVLAYHALTLVDDWRDYIAKVAKLANKAFVVTVCNPQNWGVEIIRMIGKVRGIEGLDPPEAWRTEILAPVLWSHGRVKEHEFFDCPWWPDLQVSPGQSLLDRAKKLVTTRKKGVQFTADGSDSQLASRFVYGAERWPYFGDDDGFSDELEPALRRHPSFEHAKGARIKSLAGHLHAFLVDVTPRNPQQRRRLQLSGTGPSGAHDASEAGKGGGTGEHGGKPS